VEFHTEILENGDWNFCMHFCMDLENGCEFVTNLRTKFHVKFHWFCQPVTLPTQEKQEEKQHYEQLLEVHGKTGETALSKKKAEHEHHKEVKMAKKHWKQGLGFSHHEEEKKYHEWLANGRSFQKKEEAYAALRAAQNQPNQSVGELAKQWNEMNEEEQYRKWLEDGKKFAHLETAAKADAEKRAEHHAEVEGAGGKVSGRAGTAHRSHQFDGKKASTHKSVTIHAHPHGYYNGDDQGDDHGDDGNNDSIASGRDWQKLSGSQGSPAASQNSGSHLDVESISPRSPGSHSSSSSSSGQHSGKQWKLESSESEEHHKQEQHIKDSILNYEIRAAVQNTKITIIIKQ
jgi:hypothetical protein